MSPRPRTATDEEILEGTARALGRVGPQRLTLVEVAREVGLAPATLVQRFGSKRGLLLAFAERAAAGAVEPFAAAREGSGGPLAVLAAGLMAMSRGAETPAAPTNHLAVLLLAVDDPELRAHAVAHTRAVRDELVYLLGEAIEAGELRPCNPARVGRALQAAFNGSLLAWAIHREGPVADWVREDLEIVLQPYRPR